MKNIDAADETPKGRSTVDTGELPDAKNVFDELSFEDIKRVDDGESDSLETIQELEREIGIADWIDPETGEPAEGQSPPHLNDE
jgi:hypothetical protein